MFKDARKNVHLLKGGIIPALNELGEPVCLLKLMSGKGYVHKYEEVTERPDTRVFKLYDSVVFVGVQEYGFILLKDVLADYKGNIICVGKDWADFKCLFPASRQIEYIDKIEDLSEDYFSGKTMYLMEFCSIMAGYKQRCRDGIFSYDEIMTLVFFFSTRTSYGAENPDKKYFLVNPIFTIEGLMSISDKVQVPYAYAEANGYIPVINLTQSDDSVYSDFPNDDIWGKFFIQPYGENALDWKKSKNVYNFLHAFITFSTRWLMKKISNCKDIQLMNTNLINDFIKKEVDKIRGEVLSNPERTIGVLIRGTDYTISHLPGHAIMATPEQVGEKIEEFEKNGKYDHIFLSTEDEDILDQMKKIYGAKISYTNQKRFWIKPGELLADQKRERNNEGWQKGKEYLVTLQLLSECAAFIASGGCCGTTCALNSGIGYNDIYVFNLGTY